MKRFALFFGISALAVSCSTQEESIETPQQECVSYYASFELPTKEGTRVYANEDLLLRWTADDRVSIFGKNTYNQQYKFLGETGDNSGGFSKVDGAEYVTGNPISHVVSVYPYQASTKISESEVITVNLPAEQSYAENTFGLGSNTMVSVSSDNVLQYKNVGGYLMIKLYGEGVSVSSISLKGNNGEKLAGKASVTMPLNGVPTVLMTDDATTEITLTCTTPVQLGATEEESTQFWFVVPPVTFEKGFTITLNEATGGVFKKSTSKSITIERNRLSKMESIEVESVEPSIPAAPTGLVLHNATENGLTFQWDAMQYAASYAWELWQGGAKVQEGTTKNCNVIITGLTKATDYRFGVQAVNENGTSSAAWVDARTAGTVDPDPPTPSVAYEVFAIPSSEEDGVARAFPGAEGGGMYVTGGRGGKVIHVTNLNDSGSGSLRAAINEKGARTIVFDVAGIIELQSTLKISNGDVTIAGQTAPGDGICLKNYCFRINANNVIVRFIRCRMGDEKQTEDDAMNLYAVGKNLQDVIIDHCSLSWSTDECGSFYGMTNFSLQWCILSESLRNSVHGKGKHGYGGIWGGTNATYHHNLLAHHDSRNPRLDHDYLSTLKGPVSLVNNVIYNWGDNSTYGGESANDDREYRKYNIVNNYYKPGPATRAGKVHFIDPWTKACSNCTNATGSSTIVPGHFYMNGNVMDGDEGKTADNWTGTTASAEVIANIMSNAQFTYAPQASSLSLHPATSAFSTVLDYAGASLKRDAVDARIASETRNGNYTYQGSNGSTNGFIDTQSDVGGWPAYCATADGLDKVKDTDGDGIPDTVEDAFGMDKTSAADGNAKTLDKNGRYTNLEMYLHFLVKDIVTAQNKGSDYLESL